MNDFPTDLKVRHDCQLPDPNAATFGDVVWNLDGQCFVCTQCGARWTLSGKRLMTFDAAFVKETLDLPWPEYVRRMDDALAHGLTWPEYLHQAAEAFRDDPTRVIGHWPGTIAELAAMLDCDETSALMAALYAAPRREQDVSDWAADVASALALDVKRVTKLGARCRR